MVSMRLVRGLHAAIIVRSGSFDRGGIRRTALQIESRFGKINMRSDDASGDLNMRFSSRNR